MLLYQLLIPVLVVRYVRNSGALTGNYTILISQHIEGYCSSMTDAVISTLDTCIGSEIFEELWSSDR